MVTESVTLDERRKGLSKKESYLLSYLAENRKNIFSVLDPTKEKIGKYHSKWRLLIKVSEDIFKKRGDFPMIWILPL